MKHRPKKKGEREMRRYDTVLFDLDGTLIDTNELIIQSFFYALREVRPNLARAEIIPQMGKTLKEQLQILSGLHEVGQLLLAYREFNVAHHNQLARIFPRVEQVLARLHDEQMRIAVVTTKMRASTERSLNYFGIRQYIQEIVTVEDVNHPKPHPEPVFQALNLLGSQASSALMIGDSQFDLLAAQQAGVDAVGVGWSLKGENHLRQFPPVTIIHDMQDLLAIIGLSEIQV
jgi:pyrophosphatase PpaX